MEKEIEVQEEKPALEITGPGRYDGLLKLAIAQDVDIEKLEKLMELQRNHEANLARVAYSASMVTVHKNIKPVSKTSDNPHTHSKYAPLDAIVNDTKGIYTEEGFSVTFYEGDARDDNHIRVYADVSHALGHSKTFYYDAPLEGKGLQGNTNMTPTHAKASSISYSRRYLMCMIFNIPTGDDDDGNQGRPPGQKPAPKPGTKKPATVKQKELILKLSMSSHLNEGERASIDRALSGPGFISTKQASGLIENITNRITERKANPISPEDDTPPEVEGPAENMKYHEEMISGIMVEFGWNRAKTRAFADEQADKIFNVSCYAMLSADESRHILDEVIAKQILPI